MQRRDFIKLLSGAPAGWPLVARAQQPALPVIGLIRDGSASTSARFVAGFRKGLNENGFIEGQNVTVEYHWLEGQYDRLPALVDNLVRRQVAVLATPGNVPTHAAKLQLPESRLSSASAKIRSSLVLLPTWPDQAATRQE